MPRNRFLGARLTVTAAAMAAVLVVAACEGDNLFSVPPGAGGRAAGSDVKAPVVSISSPRGDSLSAKPLGDSVFVSTHITDNVGIRSVRMYGVAERGDAALGTNEVVSRFNEKVITLPAGVKDTTLTRYLIPTADTVKETAFIVVEAADSTGNFSADTVNLILGGPDVQLLDMENGQSVQAGLNLTARVHANDPLGIISIRVNVGGAFKATVVKTISPAADSAVMDTVIAIPAGITGQITVTAIARNNLDVAGQDGPVTLNVVSSGIGDTVAPRLKQTVTANDRMELKDYLTITVTGADNSQGSGVATVGYTVLGISPTRGDTAYRTSSTSYPPPRTGTVTKSFKVPAFNVDSLSLPDTLVYEVTTWMRDAEGQLRRGGRGRQPAIRCLCTACPADRRRRRHARVSASSARSWPERRCSSRAAARSWTRRWIPPASGCTCRTSPRNRLEVFDLQSELFRPAIGVGSEPWGLAFSRNNDSLWVANSGGTNLSRGGPERRAGGGQRALPHARRDPLRRRVEDGRRRQLSADRIPQARPRRRSPTARSTWPWTRSATWSSRPRRRWSATWAPCGRASSKTAGTVPRPSCSWSTPNFPLAENSWAIAHVDSHLQRRGHALCGHRFDADRYWPRPWPSTTTCPASPTR